ncbi:hypothetical protein ACI2L1_43840 [Streptomyces sp. NPDC019531]|uniref:hypothetical protein n=1 Tax=Streptomyces sp. NPDC019531 TaxID=3365062 RepID=UPI00384DEBFE
MDGVGGSVVGAVAGLFGGAVGVGELRWEVLFQDLHPLVQADEAAGAGLRLDQFGQSLDERLSRGAWFDRGGGPSQTFVRGREVGVEWTLLWIENTAGQLTEGRP